jgi:hypothetical protein
MDKKKSSRVKMWLLFFSLALNVFLVGKLLIEKFNSPTYQLGQLTQSIKVGLFGKDTTYFVLPKGLTVRNVSPQGIAAIGQFENNRFDIIVTTDNASLVNYNLKENELLPFGNYYSANQFSTSTK